MEPLLLPTRMGDGRAPDPRGAAAPASAGAAGEKAGDATPSRGGLRAGTPVRCARGLPGGAWPLGGAGLRLLCGEASSCMRSIPADV